MNWYLIVLKKYADFKGRARRKEYWMFVLFNMIISMILSVLDSTIGLSVGISMIYSIAVMVPGISVGIRRMHDVGKSGWFLLFPIYNIILTIRDGDKGVNEYGSDPKNPIDELDEIGTSES
ncbi:DUF805 domain-containing protein [Flavicella sp.]|uniref:DUF805 domain-containing protein n=1 Tax=Flavicella sp. TaxID=2957742 RepID=UPI0030168D0C